MVPFKVALAIGVAVAPSTTLVAASAFVEDVVMLDEADACGGGVSETEPVVGVEEPELVLKVSVPPSRRTTAYRSAVTRDRLVARKSAEVAVHSHLVCMMQVPDEGCKPGYLHQTPEVGGFRAIGGIRRLRDFLLRVDDVVRR